MSDRPSPCPRKRSRDTCIGHRSARRGRPDAGDPLRTPARCPPGRTGGGRPGRHHAPHGGRACCHRRGPVACSGRSGSRSTGVPDRPRAAHDRRARAQHPWSTEGLAEGVPSGTGRPRSRRPRRRRSVTGLRPAVGGPGPRTEPVPYGMPVVPDGDLAPSGVRAPAREGDGVASTAGRAAGRVTGTAQGLRVRETRRPSAVRRTADTRLPNPPYTKRRRTPGEFAARPSVGPGRHTIRAPDRARAEPARKPPPTVGARCADWTGPSGACARPRRPARSSTPRARSP